MERRRFWCLYHFETIPFPFPTIPEGFCITRTVIAHRFSAFLLQAEQSTRQPLGFGGRAFLCTVKCDREAPNCPTRTDHSVRKPLLISEINQEKKSEKYDLHPKDSAQPPGPPHRPVFQAARGPGSATPQAPQSSPSCLSSVFRGRVHHLCSTSAFGFFPECAQVDTK